MKFDLAVQSNIEYWLQKIQKDSDFGGTSFLVDQNNVLHAIYYGLSTDLAISSTIKLLVDIFPIVEFHGAWVSWLPMYEIAARIYSDDSHFFECKLLNRLGILLRLTGQPKAAEFTHLGAMKIANAFNLQPQSAYSTLGMALAQWEQGAVEESKKNALEAAEFFIKSKKREKPFAASNNLLGMISFLEGDLDQAAEIFEANLIYFIASKNSRGEIQTLGNLAITRQGQNQMQEALNLFGQASNQAKLYGSLVEQAQIEFGRGALYMKLGKLENAKTSLERIIAKLAQLQFVHPMLSQVQHNLGLVLLAEGNLKAAQSYYYSEFQSWIPNNKTTLFHIDQA